MSHTCNNERYSILLLNKMAQTKVYEDWDTHYQTLTLHQQSTFTRACTWYTDPVNKYLTTLYNGAIYPRHDLLDDVVKVCSDHTVGGAFGDCIFNKPVSLRAYIDRIGYVTNFVHEIFTNPIYSIVLTQPLVVYHQTTLLPTQINGLWQCSVVKTAVKTISKPGINRFLLTITLPEGTRVIIRRTCTHEDAPDLVVVTSGQLTETHFVSRAYDMGVVSEFVTKFEPRSLPSYSDLQIARLYNDSVLDDQNGLQIL